MKMKWNHNSIKSLTTFSLTSSVELNCKYFRLLEWNSSEARELKVTFQVGLRSWIVYLIGMQQSLNWNGNWNGKKKQMSTVTWIGTFGIEELLYQYILLSIINAHLNRLNYYGCYSSQFFIHRNERHEQKGNRNHLSCKKA